MSARQPDPVTRCRVGLGCAGAWGKPWFPEREARALVQRSLERGVAMFDTGPSYAGGLAEERLGRALRGRSLDGLLLSTKVGTHPQGGGRRYHDLSTVAVQRSVDASRRRLGVDCIPLLYLHGPNPWELTTELSDQLEALRARGQVAHFGVNSYDMQVIEQAATFPVFDTFMIDYNLLRPEREPLLARLSARGHRIVAGSALANQLHAPGFFRPRRLQDLWYLMRMLARYREDRQAARRLSFLSQVPGWTPAQLALAYVLDNPHVDFAVFGTTRIPHLDENLARCDAALPPAVRKRLSDLRHRPA